VNTRTFRLSAAELPDLTLLLDKAMDGWFPPTRGHLIRIEGTWKGFDDRVHFTVTLSRRQLRCLRRLTALPVWMTGVTP